jgi:hypothetical protein
VPEQLTSQNKHKQAAAVEDVRRNRLKVKHGDTKFAFGAGG